MALSGLSNISNNNQPKPKKAKDSSKKSADYSIKQISHKPQSKFHKTKKSIPHHKRGISKTHKNSFGDRLASYYGINTRRATTEKYPTLDTTIRRKSSVENDIIEQLKIAEAFMKNITSGPRPALTPDYILNVNFDMYDSIVLIDRQNLFYRLKQLGYGTVYDVVADLSHLLGDKTLFIIVKPKFNIRDPDYFRERRNKNIISFNITCSTENDKHLQGCHEVHGFNESDDYLLLLLYDYLYKYINPKIGISILSGDNYKHTYKSIKYFYLDNTLKNKKFNVDTYFDQFSKWVLTNKIYQSIDDI